MLKEMVLYSKLDTDNTKLDMNAELLPCPFCGGEAKAQYAPAGYGLTGVNVKCTKCNVSTFTKTIGCGKLCGDHFETVTEIEAFDRAVADWNRRTES